MRKKGIENLLRSLIVETPSFQRKMGIIMSKRDARENTKKIKLANSDIIINSPHHVERALKKVYGFLENKNDAITMEDSMIMHAIEDYTNTKKSSDITGGNITPPR